MNTNDAMWLTVIAGFLWLFAMIFFIHEDLNEDQFDQEEKKDNVS